MKVKIVSDGTAVGTRIVNAETGEVLSGVQYITWSLDATNVFAEAVISLVDVPIELTVDAHVEHDTIPSTSSDEKAK